MWAENLGTQADVRLKWGPLNTVFTNNKNIDDEIYFLIYCHNYSSIRDDFYNKMYNPLPNFKQLSLNELIIKLMKSEDYFINTQLLKFILTVLISETNYYRSSLEIYIIHCNLFIMIFFVCLFVYLLTFYIILRFCNTVTIHSHANKACCCFCCIMFVQFIPFVF